VRVWPDGHVHGHSRLGRTPQSTGVTHPMLYVATFIGGSVWTLLVVYLVWIVGSGVVG
jgi:hypothetical protein